MVTQWFNNIKSLPFSHTDIDKLHMSLQKASLYVMFGNL